MNIVGELIKYDQYYWLVENVKDGIAELWYNGKCIFVPLDDLDY